MKIILASQSAARKKALELIGVEFDVMASDFDENQVVDTDPVRLAQRLAESKAQAVGERVGGGSLVVAGDMFTVLHGTALQKPADMSEALQMLNSLSGQTFQIIGSVAVYNTETKITTSAVSTCDVTFRELTNFEIEDYMSRYPVLDYAGAFNGDAVLRFAREVHGSCNFATGFSVNEVVSLLRAEGAQV